MFKKRVNRKHLIVYKRIGQADYWLEADDFLIFHDLSHYAIERTLKYNNAFWGLIKSGINPSIFENKIERDQLFITDEAWYAECLANLFLIEITQGKFENFHQVFRESFMQMYPEKTTPKITDQEIDAIRSYYAELIQQWKSLKTDQLLTVTF
jgi:hypothetical protein